MKWPKLALSVLAVSFVVPAAPVALADTPPSQWDRAQNPAIGDTWDLHVRVVDEMVVAFQLPKGSGRREAILNLVRSQLESAGAATSPDIRLRFDLGEVYQELDHFVAALEVLEPALALAPDDPGAETAWSIVATAQAKLDRSREEIRAYDKILELTVDLFQRSRIVANRAEAEMRLGNLDEAVLGYREALALSESVTGLSELYKQSVLARWGLAVALDRSGDPSSALREAMLALSQDGARIIQDTETVFFVPKYEIFYYLALGKTALSQKPWSAKDAVKSWSDAEDLWGAYIEGAEGAREDCERLRSAPASPCADDLWLGIARAHLTSAQKARAAAEKRAGFKRTPRGQKSRQIMIE